MALNFIVEVIQNETVKDMRSCMKLFWVEGADVEHTSLVKFTLNLKKLKPASSVINCLTIGIETLVSA
jgi:hypothetical protein